MMLSAPPSQIKTFNYFEMLVSYSGPLSFIQRLLSVALEVVISTGKLVKLDNHIIQSGYVCVGAFSPVSLSAGSSIKQ